MRLSALATHQSQSSVPKPAAARSNIARALDRTAICLCGLAILYLFLGIFVKFRPVPIRASVLAAVDPSEPVVTGGGFAPEAVFTQVAFSPAVEGVKLYGSAVNGDSSTGLVRTRWYKPTNVFYLLLAGYPLHAGEQLFLELQTDDARLLRQDLNLNDNPEQWLLKKVHLPLDQHVREFRIVAGDASRTSQGWLGFSEPFLITDSSPLKLAKQILLLLLCLVAALVAVLGPGLCLRARSRHLFSAVWLPFPGIVILAGIGILAWKGPSALSPATISRICLLLLFAAVGWQLMQTPLSSLTTFWERRVLFVICLLIALALAKATYSLGPAGELYGRHISRTLEVGGRGDSRIPYHIVQLVALREKAFSEFAHRLFAPWNFSHRGPLTGLAASPLVLSAGAEPPHGMPDETWTVFDEQGFAAFRVAAVVISGACLFAVFGLAQLFLDEQWSLLAFLAVATAPFTVHEVFFTWPKIPAAAFVLLADYLVKRKHHLLAGLAVGLGYLCHPSALLWFPAVLLLIPVFKWRECRFTSKHLLTLTKHGAFTCAGLGFWMLLWRWINRGHYHQDAFLQYFFSAGALARTPSNWLRSRSVAVLNTLVPLYSFLFHRKDLDIIANTRTPNAWVQFVQQYWCTLALGSGCVFYFAVLRAVAVAWSKARAWIVLIFAPSLALFTIYFGAPNTGLMREGLHAWFFGLLLFTVIMWRKHLATSNAFWKLVTVAFAVRGVEILLVLLPLSGPSGGYILQPGYQASDLASLLVMVAGTAALIAFSLRHLANVRREANRVTASSLSTA